MKRKKKRRGVSGLSLKKGRDSQGMSFAFSVALSLFRVFYLNLSTGDGFRWVTVIKYQHGCGGYFILHSVYYNHFLLLTFGIRN